MATATYTETSNLWSYISSHNLLDFITRHGSYINGIFLDSLDTIYTDRFILRVTNIRLGEAHGHHGGLYIDISITDLQTNSSLFNDLHISIHSVPGGPSQSHISTKTQFLSPLDKQYDRLNLKFSKHIGSDDIGVELQDLNELNDFCHIHRLSRRYDLDDLDKIQYILSRIIPQGLRNILLSIDRHITKDIDMSRSQSVITDDEHRSIRSDITAMQPRLAELSRLIEGYEQTQRDNEEKLRNLQALQASYQLSEDERSNLNGLNRIINERYIENRIRDLQTEYDAINRESTIQQQRLIPHHLQRMYRQKYLKYKQKYLQLKNSLKYK